MQEDYRPDLAGLHAPHAALLRAALEELSPPRAGLALDIGCGPGLKVGWLAGRLAPGGLLLGLDIDPAAAVAARDGGMDALVADAAALPLRPGRADLAWMVATLGLLPRPALALAEARRALRPGGSLVVAAAGELWARPRAWPPALAAALGPLGPLPPADGLADALAGALAAAGFAPPDARAYLLEPAGLAPHAARLPLLAWGDLAPLAAGRLSSAELAACAAAEAAAEPEPLPLLIVAAARPRQG